MGAEYAEEMFVMFVFCATELWSNLSQFNWKLWIVVYLLLDKVSLQEYKF